MIKIFEMGKIRDEEIFARFEPTSSVEDIVKDIIANVRKNGDEALKEYSSKFDHVDLTDFQVSESEIEAALKQVEPEFIKVLEEAAENISAFHEKQVRNSFIMADKPGVILGQRVIPLEKVGLYVPGGTAAYPSTVLMDSIPAKIAGVEEIVMVTPPNKESSVNPYILAAAHVAGVGRIFKIGGAQAVAALAYGTESIPRVDKIVGPGNAFVAEAKKQVFGQVGIDMIAGPSEVLVLA
nr:histidinol dehydrogenase [Oribacterium sp.]